MYNLIMMFLVIFLLLMVIFVLIILIGKKVMIDVQKSTPFECGFSPISSKRLPFSIYFFLISVIFLIFDIEIVIILPMVLTLPYSMLYYWFLTMVIFVGVLSLGLYHEWLSGLLNWA